MLLLLLFALLAGAGTALSPCVLPVLPALLAATGTGGRRRPLGVVTGLLVTYTLTIVGLATLARGVGIADGALRTLAIVVLLAAGLALLLPRLGAAVEGRLSALGRLGPTTSGSGFWSGLPVGGALGFVYAPCAGPILAAVISVSATGGTSVRLVAVGLAYAVGSALVLGLIGLGGQRVFERVRRRGGAVRLQRGLGAVLVLTAGVMFARLDIRLESALAKHVPSFLVDPTGGLERSSAVRGRLDGLRGRSRFADSNRAPSRALPDLGTAPELTGTGHWFNTPGGAPLSLARLHGRVVLLDFWTYTCINCLRTLPFLRALDQRYRSAGLTVVGVHTPEFSFERETGNVADAIRANGLRYPVVQDNAYGTWNAYGNQYWPAEYLVDARGEVRHTQFGEGDYQGSEAALRALLTEAGGHPLPPPVTARPEMPAAELATPETYLGAARAKGIVPHGVRLGTHDYPGLSGPLPLSRLALRGRWTVTREAATATRGASLDLSFQAQKAYLVLSSRGDAPRPVRVALDGRPIAAPDAGDDVRAGTATVRGQRLYRLVALPRVGRHRLTLDLAPGVSGYAFTFG